MSTSKLACLFFVPKLTGLEKSFEISKEIKIINSFNSQEAKAFFDLVEEHKLINVGEPNSYSLCVVLNKQPYYPEFDDPYTLINRFSNILAVNTASPIIEGHVIVSENEFKSIKYLGSHFSFTHSKFEHFQDLYGVMNQNSLDDLKIMWANYSDVWNSKKSLGRLSNALTFFYQAWNSQYMESFCINLTIVFELLFAPHSHSETSHQISYNVSRFVADDKDKRKSIYTAMKKFYSIRSRIIHGGLPDEEKIIQPTKSAFLLCANILKKILLDQKLTNTFNDEKQRKDLMENFVFS